MFFNRGYDRRILVALADTHGGHKLGLCSPSVGFPRFTAQGERYLHTPELTKAQEWLNGCYKEDRQRVEDLANGDSLLVFHVGDECHGDKYPEQLVSTQNGAQIRVAVENMRPWYEMRNVEKVRFFSGTPAHNFGEDTSTMQVVDQLSAEYPGVETKLVQHGLEDVDGVKFDVAHKGPSPGTRRYTKGRSLTYYTESKMQQALEDWKKPPRVLIRAHYHELCIQVATKKTSHGLYKTQAVILPAYCGLSDHGRNATQSVDHIDAGLVAFEIVDGKLVDTYPFFRTQDLRTKEVL